jgi:peptidoglycan hydrolase CwlO-like protein
MNAPTIETDLGQVLDHINQNLAEFRKETNQKLESIQKDITVLKVDMATVKTEIAGLKDDIKEIKGSQKSQIWSLITILGTVAIGAVIRFVITAMPSGNP